MNGLKQRTSLFFLLILAYGVMNIVLGARPFPQDPDGPPVSDDQPTEQQKQAVKSGDGEKAYIDYRADRYGQDSPEDTVIKMRGNVAFHHNGVFIQCDSAFRYDSMRYDCFGRVIINKDSTYIYGDKVSYDGNLDLATVYSKLIKMVNGNVTLYTYHMQFNTLTSIGSYWGGGMMIRGDNLMESQRGIYDADKDIIKFLDEVALRSEDYVISTDSASYDINTEVVTFLSRPYIWDHERDFLTAELGEYRTKNEMYLFTGNAYAMTPDQEMWADTMQYVTPMKEAFMYSNIQITDTIQRTLAFGDWGYYSDSLKNAILTRTPSVLAWEKPDSPGSPADTAYVAADSIFMHTFPKGGSKRLGSFDDEAPTHTGVTSRIDSIMTADSLMIADSLGRIQLHDGHPPDSIPAGGLVMPLDSTSLSPGEPDIPGIEDVASDAPAEDPAGQKYDLDVEAEEGETLSEAMRREMEREAKQARKEQKKVEKAARKSKSKKEAEIPVPADTSGIEPEFDEFWIGDSLAGAIEGEIPDSLAMAADSLVMGADSLAAAPKTAKDSTERVVKAYYNVKMYRSDFQGVADSTISFSVDSTMNLFGRPVLWNGSSQIVSDRMDIFTEDGQIEHVDFIGTPLISEQVDDTRFNQARGRTLTAFFTDGEIDFAFLSQNVVNYYYYLDENEDIAAFAWVQCGDMRTDFKGREPHKMVWIGSPNYAIYPINQIPPDQPVLMDGFVWHGDMRPRSKKDIFDRSTRPTERAYWSQLEQPGFGISDKINAFKAEIIGNGTWVDRNDLLNVTIESFDPVY